MTDFLIVMGVWLVVSFISGRLIGRWLANTPVRQDLAELRRVRVPADMFEEAE